MKKLNQTGIAGTLVALIIVLVLAVGGVGYYVWHTKQATDKTLNDTSNSVGEPTNATSKNTTTSTTTKPADSIKYLAIKEWKVEITLSVATKDTQYAFANGSSSTVYIYSKTVADKYAGCQGGGYTLVRANGNDTIGNTTYEAAAKDPQSGFNKDIKKVGDYYYRRVSHQVYCTSQSTADEKAASALLSPTFDTLQVTN